MSYCSKGALATAMNWDVDPDDPKLSDQQWMAKIARFKETETSRWKEHLTQTVFQGEDVSNVPFFFVDSNYRQKSAFQSKCMQCTSI